MEALTALRILTVRGYGDICIAYKTLARCLRSMRLLECLHLSVGTEEDGLAVGQCLRAWPPPRLRECSNMHGVRQYTLRGHWRELGLPAEVVEWKDIEINCGALPGAAE